LRLPNASTPPSSSSAAAKVSPLRAGWCQDRLAHLLRLPRLSQGVGMAGGNLDGRMGRCRKVEVSPH